MRGKAVFAAFFLLFTIASLAVPVPLFPGNMIPGLLNVTETAYASLVNAITNGVVYGLFVWLVFVLATRTLEEPQFNASKRKKTHNNKKRQ
mgnify:CR=1 FL=1